MKAIDLVGRVFGQRTAGAIERAIHILRNRFAPPCTCPQAVEDFAAIAHGSLDVEGLLRLARHTSHCLSCRDAGDSGLRGHTARSSSSTGSAAAELAHQVSAAELAHQVSAAELAHQVGAAEVSGELGAADLQVILAVRAEVTHPNGRQPREKLR